jgi:hypothetical protein
VSYVPYYGSYRAARYINHVGNRFGLAGTTAAHLIALPLAPIEFAGLWGDAVNDAIKPENIDDEGIYGCRLPLHRETGVCGGTVFLPGIEKNFSKVDFYW